MKLIKAEVENFGNLKNFSIDFSDGLNCIVRENGFGKSTLAVFIKAMFYGLNTKKSIKDGERKKYRPWGGVERFGGSLEFFRNGKTYRIERFFGKKESLDTAVLIDECDGTRLDLKRDGETIGESIFGIDAEGFSSTVFFGEKDEEAPRSLITKFENGENDADFTVAMKRIETERKKYSPDRGNGGIIEQIQSEEVSLRNKLKETDNAKVRLIELVEEKKELTQKKNEYKNLSDELASQMKTAGISEAKSQRLKEIEQKKKSLTERFGGRIITLDEVKAVKDCYDDYQSLANKTVGASESVTTNEKTLKKKKNIPWIIASLIILIVGIVSAGIGIAKTGGASDRAGLIILGVACFFAGLIFLTVASTIPESESKDAEKKVRNKENENLKNQLLERLNSYFSRTKTEGRNLNEKTENLYKSVLEFNMLTAEENDVKRSVLNENIPSDISANAPINDGKAVEDRLRQCSDMYLYYVDLIAKCDAEIRSLDAVIGDEQSIKIKLKEKETEEAEARRKTEILSLTEKFLSDAEKEIKNKYRKPLEESLNRYLEKSSAKKFRAEIDGDLNVFIKEGSAFIQSEYFSHGERKIIEIAKRFALVDSLFLKEKPFIVLDDPFCDLDANNTALVISSLRRLEEDYQIIYFCCHESRATC